MFCRLSPREPRFWVFVWGLFLAGGSPGFAAESEPFIPFNSTTDADCVVAFNEVFYHPAPNRPELEWIELHNQLALDQDLSDWSIEGGVRFHFPQGTTLKAGAYLVIAANPAALQTESGVTGALGPWSGRLDNAGDHLVLRNLHGRLMDELEYDDDAPWPIAADGSGASLAKRHPLAPSSPAENWRASREPGGTPGALNFPAPGLTPPPVVDTLLAQSAPGRWQIPTAALADLDWTTADFNDVAWRTGTNGFGFTRSTDPAVLAAQRYYRFEGAGSDASGNRIHGLAENGARYSPNPAPATGSSYSLRCDGNDEFFRVNDAVSPRDYTLSVWVKFQAVRPCSLMLRTEASGPQSTWSHQLRINAQGRFEHYSFDGGERVVTGTTVAEPDRWYHVAGTAESHGVGRLYVNGQEEGTAVPLGEIEERGTRWIFGSNSGASAHFLRGWLDDIAIWHQALPAASITALAAGTPPATDPGLAGTFFTDLSAAMPGVNASAWFRLPLVRPASAFYDQLTLSVRYADGFVAWLNGVEVARRNAPVGTGWNSAATAERTAEQAVQPELIPLDEHLGLLRPGTNILAVQGLNFSADHPDFLIEPTLTARRAESSATDLPVAFSEVPSADTRPFWIELVNQSALPQNLGALALRTTEGELVRLGEGTLAPGAWQAISFPGLDGPFREGALLALISADGAQIVDAVRLSRRLQARPTGATDGEFLRPAVSTPGAENRFAFSDEIVINEILYHAPPTLARPGTPPEIQTTPLIRWDSVWRYEASGSGPDASWFTADFDDSTWARGAGILGFRSGALAEPIRTPLPAGQWTYYFRIPFVLTAPPPGDCPLSFRFLVDDGAVFYLNGQEFYRHGLPDGEITPSTPAISVSDPSVIGPLTLDTTGLIIGTNWLAVEVHQWNPDSSDLVCGVELLSCAVAKPGIPATPFAENDTQWIELFNRSDRPINLGGWQLAEGISFTFPPNTFLAAGEYLVVARDAAALRSQHPELRVLGDFTGRLSRRSDRVRLLDAYGNPADDVRYFDDRPWPHAADGGGSSLELRDPRADNSVPEAWAASDETHRSGWHSYRYRATARDPVFGPPLHGFHELRLGLLDDGELLLDNVSVLEDPDGARTELIQNGDFTEGAARWRLLGNHSHSRVEEDPERPGNSVLRVVATDARGYMHNQLETTLKSGTRVTPVRAGVDYEISFEAKWLSGTPQFHAELYYNRVVRKFLLEQPATIGTPGRRNSTYEENLGPTYTHLRHEPAVPRPGQPIRVRVHASDPDGVAALTLRYLINSGGVQATTMSPQGDGFFEGTIPAQTTAGTVIQFWVEGRDTPGATSFAPAGGSASRALVRVDTRNPGARRRAFHLIINSRDAAHLHDFENLMSDDRLGATVVWDNRDIFYDCGVHLHGSMFSRNDPDSCSFNIRFPADHAFRGVHRTVQVKRRAMQEIIAKFTQVQAGVPGMYEDIVEFLSHRPGNSGAARMSLAHYRDIFFASQFANGDDGTAFNMEGIRVPQATDNGTPEGIKLPFPVGWVGNYDITNLGDDPEQYRWSTTIKSRRARDDYSHYLALAKAFDLSGPALIRRLPEVADVEEWMRVFALVSLFGIGDTYTQGNPHNLQFYVRPSDGRVLALPYDWDFFFANEPSAPLWGNQNLGRIIGTPFFTRLFHGQLLDLMETSFNETYLRPWVTHFSAVTGENYAWVLDRVRQRSQFVRGRLPARVNFEITSNGGADLAVNTPVVTLEGRGWIDVSEIRRTGDPALLTLTWLDAQRWRLVVPLTDVTNTIHLEARNRRGEPVGEDQIVVTTTAAPDGQRAYLRITELMYHPADSTPAERAAGWVDPEDFEFIELANLGPEELSLTGVRFVEGITFDFTSGALTTLPAGGRVLVVKNAAAFGYRYGVHLPVAGEYSGSLNNAGERLRVVDRFGAVIQEFTYSDDFPWPVEADGTGVSLEVRDPYGNLDDPGNWRVSLVPGGTPGTTATPDAAVVTIRSGDDGLVLRVRRSPGQTARLLSTEALGLDWQLRQVLEPQPHGGESEVRIPLPETGAQFYRIEIP